MSLIHDPKNPDPLGLMVYERMSRWKLGFEWLANGLFHLLVNGVYWGYNPLILTFDPNFLGYPSKSHPKVIGLDGGNPQILGHAWILTVRLCTLQYITWKWKLKMMISKFGIIPSLKS